MLFLLLSYINRFCLLMGRKGTKKEVRRYDKNAYTETLEPLVLPQAMHLNSAVYEIMCFFK